MIIISSSSSIAMNLVKILLKGEFRVSAHGQTVTSAHSIPLLLKQSKPLMQETEAMPTEQCQVELLIGNLNFRVRNLLHANR